jgi:zinc and cadmium transporter
MNEPWIFSLSSVLLVSLISFAGVITFGIKNKYLDKILLLLVSFSAGALLGGAFLHLIPEALEKFTSTRAVTLLILAGMLVFFLLEKFIHWRHCHIPTSKSHPHHMATMNLVGDGLHNFIDGMIIASSYLINTQLGITATIAVILHEIPQEIGDFSVLIYSGLDKTKALLMNFLSALIAVLGTVFTLIMGAKVASFSAFLIPIAAGGFIYISGTDIIPELHKECGTSKSLLQTLSLVLGVLLMLALVFLG